MIRNLLFIAMVLALGTLLVPTASADSFQLNVLYCNCIPVGDSAGTVDVTKVSDNVAEIDVTLAPDLAFHDQGQTSFSFNIVDPNLIVDSKYVALGSSAFNITNDGGSTWTFQQPANNSDGAGNFQYGFECASGPNHCAGVPTVFDFTITDSNGTGIGNNLAWIESTNGGKSNVDFSANVALQSANSCTGQAGGGSGSVDATASGGSTGTTCNPSFPTVPEPTSVLLFGTALVFAGMFLRPRLLA